MKKIFILLLLCPLFALAQDKLSERNYRIYSVAMKKEIGIKDLVKEMNDYDVVFFSEEHNDSVAHYLEKTILELMQLKFGAQLALSMEMFDRDVQPIMNEYLKGFVKEKNFIRDARAWQNYYDYKALIKFAKENKIDVICANAASRYGDVAGKWGQKELKELPDESRDYFAPVPFDTATGDYYLRIYEKAGHPLVNKGDTTGPRASNIVNGMNLGMTQSLYDATIAHSISQYFKKNKGKKIFEINGKLLSDYSGGAVAQLKNYNSKLKILVISTVVDDSFPDIIDWSKYKKEGSFIIMTDPNVPRTFID